MTLLHRKAAVWWSGQPLRFISTRSLVHPFAANAAFLHGKACHWIRGSLCSPMNPVPLPPSRGNKRLCRCPLRPLEGERATRWRGGAVRQEPQMTTPSRQAAVWRSGHRFGQFVPENDCMLPVDIVISSGGIRRYGWQGLWALMKRRAERSPVAMELATFRSEISPLRFAAVEMTVAVPSRAEEHIGMGGKNLNLLNPMNPGRGAAHPAAPFRLAALATHPREGGGQVTWRRRTLPSNPLSHFVGGRRPRPSNLPFPSMGEGDHAPQTCLPPLVGGRGTTKWWRGVAEGGIIKKLRRSRHHHPRPERPSNLRTLRPKAGSS